MVVKRLNARVLQCHGINSKLKGHFIGSTVVASLLYGLEHCPIGIRERRCLDGYFLRLAKRILHLRYNYHLSYEEAEQRLGIVRPSARLTADRLRWTGHLLRSSDTILLEVLAFVPSGGARGRGRPRRRYSDTIKADLQERGIIIDARTQQEFLDEVAVLTNCSSGRTLR